MYNIYYSKVQDTSQCESYKADCLIGIGLLDSATKSISIDNINGSQTERHVQVNSLGELFCCISLV